MKDFFKGMYHFHSYSHLLGFVLLQTVVYIGIVHAGLHFFYIPAPTTLGLQWMGYSVLSVLFTGLLDRAMIVTSKPKE